MVAVRDLADQSLGLGCLVAENSCLIVEYRQHESVSSQLEALVNQIQAVLLALVA